MSRPTPTIVGALAVVVLVLLACGVATASPAYPQPPGAPAASSAAGAEPSWIARVMYPVLGRRGPDPRAARAARLMHYTAFSRRPQELMVTGFASDPSGREWVRVQVPRRPNGSQAWVPRAAVTLRAVRVRIRVLLNSRRVEIWRSGVRVRSFPAAVGTGRTPTPAGRFAVQDPVPAAGHQRSYLGPYIVTLTAYSPVLRTFMGGNGLVAIHGTNAPGLLGQAVSHGCVRVSNGAIVQINRVARPGVPVEIVRA